MLTYLFVTAVAVGSAVLLALVEHVITCVRVRRGSIVRTGAL